MEEIISKISDLFIKYGFKSLVMDDIARELGISKKTLYNQFENKTDLLSKVVHIILKREFNQLDKLILQNTNAIDQLQTIAAYIVGNLLTLNPLLPYELHKYYPGVFASLKNERREFIISRIKHNFSLGIEQGLYRENLDNHILAFYYSNFLDIKGIDLFNGKLDEEYEKVFRTISIISLRGIATSIGMEYIEKKFYNETNKSWL
jgi:TetR/AcrR family transcriptional regulator, cholesterol catabolism regulator